MQGILGGLGMSFACCLWRRYRWIPSFWNNQEDHVVLTIRVPKAVIRNNLQLLMGLADRSLGRD